MTKRASISRKTRFEVFKRDKFTCQYCGAKAPDTLLQLDHIEPVSKGGGSDILNLVTACELCNGGKGARRLADHSEIERQRSQLEELEARRQQLEMLLQWREELLEFDEQVLEKISEIVSQKSGFSLNRNGKSDFKKWLKRFSFDEVLEAIDIAFDQYAKFDKSGKATEESCNLAIQKIPGIARVRREGRDRPYLRELFYIRGILRNRIHVNEAIIIDLMERAHNMGLPLEEITDLAKTVPSWTAFRNYLEEFIEGPEVEPQ